MNSEGLELICQQCGGVLHLGADAARCEKGHRYPLVLGRILDMVADNEGSSDAEEARLAATMSLAFEQATYAELLVLLNGYHSEAPDHLRSVYTDYVRSAISRNRWMALTFRTQASQWCNLSPDGSALELGCGFGGSFPVLSQLYKRVAGIEPSLSRLILAAKLLDEQNIHNVQLVRAYAQHVPFRDASFDYVTAINVMEHVLDVGGVMHEVHRLLRSGGVFLADSRNRYDLFFREPHVKLRLVGFLPRTMARKYVHWRTGLSYDKTELLSCGDWRKALSPTDWRYHIALAKAQAYGYSAKADLFLERLSRVPLLRHLLLAIAPSHLIVAEKRADNARLRTRQETSSRTGSVGDRPEQEVVI